MMIVLVCTGNTCRSPMAEALLKKLAAEKLGCSVSELDARGVTIMSAGVSATPGGCAAPEAVATMKSRGIDITCHETQPLTEKVVRFADLVLTLTNGHRQQILRRWPEAATRTQTLRLDQVDIDDPIGGPPEVYQRCAIEIEEALRERVKGLEFK